MPNKITQKICETCKRVFKSEKDFLNNTYQWRLCSAENLWFNCSCGSTLMLPKGKFPWYSPTMLLSEEAQSVFNKIAQINDLPHIPAAVMNIQQMLNDVSVETSQLAKAIKGDPFLAAEILRVADNLRNLRNKHQSPMQSLEHAITYIGRKSIGDLVLAASIKAFKLPTSIFDEKIFWQHSFLTAAISEILAQRLMPEIEKDKAYLAGCLANIGKIIAALCFAEQIDRVQSQVSNLSTMTYWEKAEEDNNLISHCILGEIGAAMWGLPKFVIDTARFHHTKIDNRKFKIGIPAVAGFANLLAHWVSLEPSRIDEALLDNYKSVFQISDKELDSMVNNDLIPIKDKISSIVSDQIQ